jgi:hypothetical protein
MSGISINDLQCRTLPVNSGQLARYILKSAIVALGFEYLVETYCPVK